MSLALRNRDKILAKQMASAPASGGGFAPAAIVKTIAAGSPADRALAQMKLRLRHDLQRLKQIKSITLKVAAKRVMLPEYRAWCDGLLEAGRCTVGNDLSGPTDEVLPTIMVWSIDICDWPLALALAEHVMRFRIPMPQRYKRDAATVIVENIAIEAIKVQQSGSAFPLDVLESVEVLTAGADIFDEVRAKLGKAIGNELARRAATLEPRSPEFIAAAERTLAIFRAAHILHDRIGVKDSINRLERAIAPPKPTTKPAGTPPAA